MPLSISASALPDLTQRLLREGDLRVREFQRQHPRRRGFVPSDFESVARVLATIVEQGLAAGPRFCEWGSGFGVVAAAASTLGFEAYGIEIQGELVELARELALKFELEVEFAHGTLVPEQSTSRSEGEGGTSTEDEHAPAEYSWWDQDAADGHTELGATIADFDVIFAYPWPGEEEWIESLFLQEGADGALLVTHHGVSGTLVQRRTGQANLEELGWC